MIPILIILSIDVACIFITILWARHGWIRKSSVPSLDELREARFDAAYWKTQWDIATRRLLEIEERNEHLENTRER